MKHMILECYCDCKEKKSGLLCEKDDFKIGSYCLKNSCKYFSYTIAPNEIAYSNDKGIVENELDFVGFGGEMNPEDNDKIEECIDKWHEICTRKIDEAYEEYMMDLGDDRLI